MEDNEGVRLTKSENATVDWIFGPYFSGLYVLLDSNRSYLNQGITWSIGILTAVILFILTYVSPLLNIKDSAGNVVGRSFDVLPNNIATADTLILATALSVACTFIANFMSRLMKGYLNII